MHTCPQKDPIPSRRRGRGEGVTGRQQCVAISISHDTWHVTNGANGRRSAINQANDATDGTMERTRLLHAGSTRSMCRALPFCTKVIWHLKRVNESVQPLSLSFYSICNPKENPESNRSQTHWRDPTAASNDASDWPMCLIPSSSTSRTHTVRLEFRVPFIMWLTR